MKLQRVRAPDITNAIISTLEDVGISLQDLRGQCFDGASNMSGNKSGVQKRIKDRQPKAIYTHCASHSLSLSIVSCCSSTVSAQLHFSDQEYYYMDKIVTKAKWFFESYTAKGYSKWYSLK